MIRESKPFSLTTLDSNGISILAGVLDSVGFYLVRIPATPTLARRWKLVRKPQPRKSNANSGTR